MGGLKGQMGTPASIVGPRTKKEKEDYKKYLENKKHVREYFTAYRCPSCGTSTETPQKTINGKMICPSCLARMSELVEVIPYKTYKVKSSLPNKKRRRKQRKARKENPR